MHRKKRTLLLSVCLVFISSVQVMPQDIRFSLSADPLVSWFSSDTRETVNSGARPGISFGLQVDRYFSANYAFSTGIFLVNASGRVYYSDTIDLEFKNSIMELYAGEEITYKIQYLTIPLGLKLNTNQIGYITLFTNVGLDPKIVIGGKADIPYASIEDENITEELKLFNLGYHIAGGVEYSLGGTTALVFGLGYENNFLDVTKDKDGQPNDRIRHNILRFKLGVNF
ncbi:MAG: porin family protein [Marinilabiliaceae bacterium]|nr:porin family protein [Marinilabiliaceae bacterium]